MDDFERFWKAYPRRVGKLAAARAWQKAHPPIEDVLNTLAWQATQWDDPQYIPHPATWINQGRWMDEPVTVKKRQDTRLPEWARD